MGNKLYSTNEELLIIECLQCQSQGRKSTVIQTDNSSTTLIQPVKTYNAETNQWTNINPNRITWTYQCSNGHQFN